MACLFQRKVVLLYPMELHVLHTDGASEPRSLGADTYAYVGVAILELRSNLKFIMNALTSAAAATACAGIRRMGFGRPLLLGYRSAGAHGQPTRAWPLRCQACSPQAEGCSMHSGDIPNCGAMPSGQSVHTS